MPPGFGPGQSLPSPRLPDARYEFSRDNGHYVQTIVRGGDRHPLRIDLVYGSGGGADEVYFTWKGDGLFELPAMWLHPTGEWGEQRSNPAPDLTRTATTRCVECHNTWLAHLPGTESGYHRDGAVFGVTCENCHGPGRGHVAAYRGGGDAGRPVVHPGRLSRNRLMDVCGQCHSNATRPRGPAFAYRPGEPLDAHFRTLAATGREHDHVANQVKYLRESKCYQQSESLTCVTCHDPHRPADPARTAAACNQCHGPADCREQPRLPVGAGGDCIGCHMPRYPRVGVNFHTAGDRYVFPVRPHEHRIGVYPAARLEVLAAWHAARPANGSREKAAGYAAELAAHRAAEADRLATAHQFLEAIGAARDAERASPTPENRNRLRRLVDTRQKLDEDLAGAQVLMAAKRFPEAIRALEGVLRVNPDSAAAHGRLGTLYAATGDRKRAVEHLRAVARCDPDDPYGYNMLGWLAYLDGRFGDAAEDFRGADELQPFSAEINYRWGLALLGREEWAAAESRFRQAVEADPNHAGAYQGLGHALAKLDRPADAVRAARRAARLTGFQNPDVLLTLADAYAAGGWYDEAVDAADRAAAVAGPDPIPATRAAGFRARRR